MRKWNIGVVVTLIVLGLLAFNNMATKIELKMRCYVHRTGNDDNHPAKVKEVLDYGVIVQCKKIRYDKLEINEHYELMDTFKAEYKIADCYFWDATEEKNGNL